MGYRSNQIAEIVGLDKNWDHDACRDEEGHFFFLVIHSEDIININICASNNNNKKRQRA